MDLSGRHAGEGGCSGQLEAVGGWVKRDARTTCELSTERGEQSVGCEMGRGLHQVAVSPFTTGEQEQPLLLVSQGDLVCTY